jgi:hypothetical protein
VSSDGIPGVVSPAARMRRLPRRLAHRRLVAGMALAVLLVAGGCSTTLPSGSVAPGSSGGAVTDPDLAAFIDRVRAGLGQQGEFVIDLSKASAASPLPSGARSLAVVASTITIWVNGERQWLAAHPAEACYMAAQATYGQAVDAIAASAVVFTDIGSGSTTDPQAAIEALIAARTTIQDADAQATASVPACTRAP